MVPNNYKQQHINKEHENQDYIRAESFLTVVQSILNPLEKLQ